MDNAMMCKAISTRQTGAVLVTALVLMAVLTMLGVSTMRSNTMDVRIHQSMKNRGNAFQCAEAALRAGEIWLNNTTAKPEVKDAGPLQASNEVWSTAGIRNVVARDYTWWSTTAWSYGIDLINADFNVGCAEQPRFVIQSMGAFGDGGDVSYKATTQSKINFYRITAYSVGTSRSSAVILQSTFSKRYN